MKFEKRNFMGIELDVLTGHPEYDLLFVATQVARAAGLKNPSAAVLGSHSLRVGNAVQVSSLSNFHRDGRMIKSNSWLMDEPRVYQMLLRGHAPASEPFRKWVTEEVLPTIRKTGKYDAEQSTNPIAQSVMDELKMLRQDVADLKSMLAGVSFIAPKVQSPEVQSPYLGTEATTVHYHFKDGQARELFEAAGFDRLVADKLMPRVVLTLAEQIRKIWDKEDGRALDTQASKTQRPWAKFPKSWLLKQMDREAYQRAVQTVLNAAIR